MTTFLATLGWGFAALLTVAVAVALWEYLQSKSRKRLPPEEPQPRRAASVDLDLDRVPDAPPGDQAQRAAALDDALGRMSSPPVAAARHAGQAWTETQPMVAASLQVELPADPPRP